MRPSADRGGGPYSGSGYALVDGLGAAARCRSGSPRYAVQPQDPGYGLVTDLGDNLIPDLVMTAASQEHGTLTARDGPRLPDLPVGTRLRILRNHACATAAQHHGYHVIDRTKPTNIAPEIQGFWKRVTGR